MRRIVLPQSREESMAIKQWIAEKHGINGALRGDNSYSYCVKEEDEIVAAAVLTYFHTEGDILLSGISSDPTIFFSRNLTKQFFSVPFNSPFNARRVTLLLNDKDKMEIKLAQRLGFKVEGHVRHHFGLTDGIILGMLRDEFFELVEG